MNITKFVTLQRRRVDVVVEYTRSAGWGLCAADALRVIKESFPDVRTELRPLVPEPSNTPMCVVRIDGMLVTNSRNRGSLYLPLKRIGAVIERCRRQRRPASTVYGADMAEKNLAEMSDLELYGVWSKGFITRRDQNWSDSG